MTTTTRTTKRRGDISREALLDAAISVIARAGLEGASHRAIAARAGTSPALTTYYFSSKTDMIRQAFDHFVERGTPTIDKAWGGARQVLDLRAAGKLDRSETIKRLANNAADYICGHENRRGDGVAFELAFLYQPRLEPDLIERVRDYRGRMLERAVSFCRAGGSADPHTDADLLMGLIVRLEFEQLSRAIHGSRGRAVAQLERYLDLILA